MIFHTGFHVDRSLLSLLVTFIGSFASQPGFPAIAHGFIEALELETESVQDNRGALLLSFLIRPEFVAEDASLSQRVVEKTNLHGDDAIAILNNCMQGGCDELVRHMLASVEDYSSEMWVSILELPAVLSSDIVKDALDSLISYIL